MLPTEMKDVLAAEGRFIPEKASRVSQAQRERQIDSPIGRIIVEEDAATLGISSGNLLGEAVSAEPGTVEDRTHLKHDLATRRYNHSCRPHFNDEGVELVGFQVRNVLRLVIAMREVGEVSRAGLVDGAEGRAKEALAKRYRVASSTCVEDLLALGVDMAQRDEDVEILGVRSILPLPHTDDKAGEGMSCDLGLLVEGVGELERLALAERLKLHARFLLGGLEGERVGMKVKAPVLSTLERPRRLLASDVGGLGFVRVVAGAPLADEERDGGNLDVWTLEPASIVLTLEPCVEE